MSPGRPRASNGTRAATNAVILVVSTGYMCVVLVIGFAAARRARGAEGLLLADRGLGAWVVGISATATRCL